MSALRFADLLSKSTHAVNRDKHKMWAQEIIILLHALYPDNPDVTYEVSSRLSDLKIHSIIDKLNPNLRAVESFNGKQRVREFYAMSPEDAYSILEAIAEIHGCVDKLKRMVPSEEEQVAEREAQEIDSESTERATNFSFSACQIPLGAKIEFGENPNITATVVGDRSVEYNGETMSLTALAKLLTGKQYSIAGPRFFKYKGEWLNDIRHRIGV